MRASSLPKLAECHHFKGGTGESDAAINGTRRHKVLECLFLLDRASDRDAAKANLDDAIAELDDDSQLASVYWAYQWIKDDIAREGYTLADVQNEVPLKIAMSCDFISGTSDVVCGNTIYDLKFGKKNYKEQLAAYTLGVMQQRNDKSSTYRSIALYAADRTVEQYNWTYASAYDCVEKVWLESDPPQGSPRPNDSCKYCSKLSTCPAVKDVAVEVSGMKVPTGDSPEAIGGRVKIAKALKAWCDDQLDKAKAWAKEGGLVEGFSIQSVAGKPKVDDPVKACSLLGIPVESVLKSVTIADLAGEYATRNCLKIGKAKTEVRDKLNESGLIKVGAGFVKLVEES